MAFARANDIVLLHDACYTEVAFDGYRPVSMLQAQGAKEVGRSGDPDLGPGTDRFPYKSLCFLTFRGGTPLPGQCLRGSGPSVGEELV